MKLFFEADREAEKEACGSKGTKDAAYQTILDALDKQIKTLTPECKKDVVCAEILKSLEKDDHDDHDHEEGEHKKCCVKALADMNMMGTAEKLCDLSAAKLKTLTADEKAAAETKYKAE